MATKTVSTPAVATPAVATPAVVRPSVRYADAYSFQWGSAKHSKDGAKLSIDTVMGQINLTEKTVGAPLVAGMSCADIENMLGRELAETRFIVRRAKQFSEHGGKATASRESLAMTGREILAEIGIESAVSSSNER